MSGAAALERFEAAIGGRLPDPLRAYLLAGAPTIWSPLPAPDGWPYDEDIEIARVYGLVGGALQRATFMSFAGRIPDVAVPLARTACGNVVAVGFDGFDAGRLWLCDRRRTATRPKLDAMRADLAARGLDDEIGADSDADADADAVVWHWERLFAAERAWRLGFADVYELPLTLAQWLEACAPVGPA